MHVGHAVELWDRSVVCLVSVECQWFLKTCRITVLGQVVRRQINANPGLRVDGGFNFSPLKMFSLLTFCELEIGHLRSWRTENINRKPH